ncbi:hypothetical protein M422DRAFT_244879 [Sphaerobolus stellatus SS14]|nr:hypothetical protein M422DRAFT_244879 [Sphaerobolus stellatus SS14]
MRLFPRVNFSNMTKPTQSTPNLDSAATASTRCISAPVFPTKIFKHSTAIKRIQNCDDLRHPLITRDDSDPMFARLYKAVEYRDGMPVINHHFFGWELESSSNFSRLSQALSDSTGDSNSVISSLSVVMGMDFPTPPRNIPGDALEDTISVVSAADDASEGGSIITLGKAIQATQRRRAQTMRFPCAPRIQPGISSRTSGRLPPPKKDPPQRLILPIPTIPPPPLSQGRPEKVPIPRVSVPSSTEKQKTSPSSCQHSTTPLSRAKDRTSKSPTSRKSSLPLSTKMDNMNSMGWSSPEVRKSDRSSIASTRNEKSYKPLAASGSFTKNEDVQTKQRIPMQPGKSTDVPGPQIASVPPPCKDATNIRAHFVNIPSLKSSASYSTQTSSRMSINSTKTSGDTSITTVTSSPDAQSVIQEVVSKHKAASIATESSASCYSCSSAARSDLKAASESSASCYSCSSAARSDLTVVHRKATARRSSSSRSRSSGGTSTASVYSISSVSSVCSDLSSISSVSSIYSVSTISSGGKTFSPSMCVTEDDFKVFKESNEFRSIIAHGSHTRKSHS